MANSNFECSTENRRSETVVALISLALLAAILAPAVAQSRRDNAQTQCLKNANQISAAILNFEAARKCFPLASTEPITGKPASDDARDPSGFSWLVMALPRLQDDGAAKLFDRLKFSSQDFQVPPFDPAVTSTDGANNVPSREFVVRSFLCPSFVASLSPPGAASDKSAAALAPQLPAISNYHALASSQFFNKEGLGRMLPPGSLAPHADGRIVATTPFEGNGALPFPGMGQQNQLAPAGGVRYGEAGRSAVPGSSAPGTVQGRQAYNGVRMGQISDGTAFTITFAETVETKFAAWIDGQVTWLVAAWPGSPDLPDKLPPVGPTFPPFNGWNAEQLPKNWTSLGKQWSPDAPLPTPPYLAANRWSGAQDRAWGPSSYHGNVVTHAFADGHTQMISLDIDKNVYLYLTTRNGRENLTDAQFKIE